MVSLLGTDIFGKGVNTLRKTGFKGLYKKGWLAIWRNPPLFQIACSVVGDLLHEKIIQSMSLGYWPQIKNPRSFNEKIAHRKLFTDEDIYPKVSDKYAVRDYVRKKVGDDVLTDVYYITDNPDSIPFDELPSEFVIKSTHGSGHTVVVKNAEDRDFGQIKRQCSDWLNTEYGRQTREYWYQEIEPRIIVEERIPSHSNGAPIDYKFFVFNGNAEFIQVNTGRFSNLKERFYDTDWNPMDFRHAYEQGEKIEKPTELKNMIDIAEKLGEDFDFVRVDLYQPNNEVYFGELTLAPGAGHLWFDPKERDFILGDLW